VTKDGRTQRDLDHSQAEIETKLAIDYMMYKGFDLSKLIANNTKTEKARSLRSKLSKSTSSNTRMKNSKPGYTKAQKLPDLKDLL
jgi:hypothetical protein